MRVKPLMLGCMIFFLCQAAAAEGLLVPKCISTFTSDFVGPMWVGDLNGDGIQKVVVGTRVHGIVNAYKYKGYDCNNDWGAVQGGGWSLSTSGDIQSMYVGELNPSAGKRVVVNGIESTYNKDSKVTKYAVVIQSNGNEDWNFKEQCGTSYTISAGDVDNTGIKNVMLGTKSSKVCVLKDNPKTRDPVLWTYQTQRPVYVIKSDDIDGDGKVEVIALDRQGYSSTLYCISSTGTLKWKYDVAGGVYIASLADKLISIADLDGNGKKEIILGTYAHGVDVLDSSGNLLWNYRTKSSSDDLVSIVYPYDLNDDGKSEVLVSAKPYLYSLSSTGSLLWKSPLDTMVYGIAVGDIYGNTENEIVVSSTRYLDVLSRAGNKIDRWTYKVEIQGKETLFQEKDANGYNVAIADLNGDGNKEVITSFGWQEDRDIVTYYYGDLRVFEVNKDFNSQGSTGNTLESETPTTLSGGEELPVTLEPPTTLSPGGKNGGLCCLPLLPAVITLALSLLAGYPIK